MDKYNIWYNRLIETRRNRILPIEVYKEKHHILPRSLGGNDSPDNLIELTAREHFIAHLLLARIYSGRNGMKMVHALRRMLTGNNRYIPNSRTYEIIRKLSMSKCSGENNPMHGRTGENHPNFGKYDVIWTEERRKHIGTTSKGRKWTQEQREKLIEVHKARWADPEYKAKMSARHKGRKKTEEHKTNIGKALKGRIVSDETRQKISMANTGKLKGTKRSDEVRQKISMSKKKNNTRNG